jgi:hypothetical protein
LLATKQGIVMSVHLARALLLALGVVIAAVLVYRVAVGAAWAPERPTGAAAAAGRREGFAGSSVATNDGSNDDAGNDDADDDADGNDGYDGYDGNGDGSTVGTYDACGGPPPRPLKCVPSALRGPVPEAAAGKVRGAFDAVLGRQPTAVEAQQYGRLVASGALTGPRLEALLRTTREYAESGAGQAASSKPSAAATAVYGEVYGEQVYGEPVGPTSEAGQRRLADDWITAGGGFNVAALAQVLRERRATEEGGGVAAVLAAPSIATPRGGGGMVDDAPIRRALRRPECRPAPPRPPKCPAPPPRPSKCEAREADWREGRRARQARDRDRDEQRQACLRSSAAETSLSDLRTARDRDQLRQACERDEGDDEPAIGGGRTPFGANDLVLDPTQAWTVPQRRPPVCVPSGRGRSVVMPTPDQTALIGTPLAEAADTQVGSMMPHFQFWEEGMERATRY